MRYTLVDIIEVKVLGGYRLHLAFDDGIEGNVDISKLVPFKGIFEPLHDKAFFSRVSVNAELGTICWENGADISPEYLRKSIQTENE